MGPFLPEQHNIGLCVWRRSKMCFCPHLFMLGFHHLTLSIWFLCAFIYTCYELPWKPCVSSSVCFTITPNQDVSFLHPPAFNFYSPSEVGEAPKGDPMCQLPIAVLQTTTNLAAWNSKYSLSHSFSRSGIWAWLT